MKVIPALLRLLPSTRAGFAIAALMILIMGSSLFAATWKASSASQLARLSQDVLQSIGDVAVNLARVQAAHRGHLLSGRIDDLRERDEAIALLGAATTHMAELTRGDPVQHGNALQLAALLSERIELALRLSRERGSAGTSPQAVRLETGLGDQLVARAYAVSQRMENEELRRLYQRSNDELERRALVRLVVVGAMLVSLSVLGFAYLGYARESGMRERAQRQLRDLAENLPVTVYQLRTGSAAGPHFEFVSNDSQSLHGVSAAEMLREPTTLWNRIVEEDRAVLSAAMKRSAHDLSPLDAEYRAHSADGGLRWIRSCASLRRERDGSILWNGYWADVTESKQFALALERAKDDADAANRAKSIFLATMSHEIRTPMNGVMAMLELLSLGRLDHEQRTMLGTVRESGLSLLRIIDDVLDFSKIEAGGLALNPEAAAVAQVVERAFQIYSGMASSKGLQLSRSIDPRIAPAHRFDALRLSQILTNFISNAIKFTPQGSVQISAEHVDTQAGRQTLRLSVKDSGIGVAAEHRAQLFQPFVQAEPGTARRYGGTGLGLAICSRLAGMMDGTIAMDSAPGHGTTLSLTLSLPIADALELPQVGAEQREEVLRTRLAVRRIAPRVDTAQADGTLVLVVDDHPTNRLVLLRQVAALGYAAESAADGVQALQLWRSGRFAIVLTDCNMPEMDGYELARRIRAEEAGSGARPMPIIACTANALDGEAQNCLDAGMNDHLAKPIALTDLMQCLDHWRPMPDTLPAEFDALGDARCSSDAAPLDHEALAAISGRCADAERAILLDFRRVNDGDALMLRHAVAQADAPMATRISHRIKGASRMVGARRLASVCEEIETSSRAGDWGAIAQRMAEFQLEMQNLNSYLDAA